MLNADQTELLHELWATWTQDKTIEHAIYFEFYNSVVRTQPTLKDCTIYDMLGAFAEPTPPTATSLKSMAAKKAAG